MKRNQFLMECNKMLINVNIALENNNIKKALLKRDDKKVIKLLRTEF